VSRKNPILDKVYEKICKDPGLTSYSLAKKLDLSCASVRFALARLAEQGLVRFKWDRSGIRTKKLTYPVKSFELLPRSLREQLREFASIIGGSSRGKRRRASPGSR
jgi:predicted transcriptional regulator